LSVEEITINDEGRTEKPEIREGVYLAGAITKVQAGYAITSIVNTTNEKVEIDEPVLKIKEVEPGTSTGSPGNNRTGCYLDRPGEVLKQLRLEHLNEERKQMEKTCVDYQHIFHLPG
jgi:hypothetical protein